MIALLAPCAGSLFSGVDKRYAKRDGNDRDDAYLDDKESFRVIVTLVVIPFHARGCSRGVRKERTRSGSFVGS